MRKDERNFHKYISHTLMWCLIINIDHIQMKCGIRLTFSTSKERATLWKLFIYATVAPHRVTEKTLQSWDVNYINNIRNVKHAFLWARFHDFAPTTHTPWIFYSWNEFTFKKAANYYTRIQLILRTFIIYINSWNNIKIRTYNIIIYSCIII